MCHLTSLLSRGGLAGLVLAFAPFLTAAPQPAIPKLDVTGLRVASYSEDGSEATIRVDYKVTALGSHRLRLEATPLRDGKDEVARWFRTEPVWLEPGSTSAAIKVRYEGDSESPYALLTDDIVIRAYYSTNSNIIRTRSFPKVISWRQSLKPGDSDKKAPAVITKTTPPTEPVEPAPATPTTTVTITPEVTITPAPEKTETIAPTIVVKPAPVEAPPTSEVPLTPTGRIVAQADPVPPPVAQSSQPMAKSDWLERLTLGPGDVLNLGLLGSPELTRADVVIGPDGRISFLEALDVNVAGMTVDEAREALDKEVGKFRHTPRTLVTPVAYKSKKYFLLGQAVRPGVFTLDRPITVVEAVARARGLQPGASQGRMIELADLSHSFLARNGARVDVDFEKLFLHGDLTQNIALAPGDYLYFPPAEMREIYVIGEVARPGAVEVSGEPTVLRAITSRGGFTPKAWKGKLLVIRGSLKEPQTFVVDASAVVTGRAPDFRLEPRDIIFVSARPWIRAEELLDTAATAFIQAAIIGWTGGSVSPIIR